MDEQKNKSEADYQLVAEHRASLVKELRAALEFAKERIKSGKGWDKQCDEVIGNALLAGHTSYEKK